MERWEDVKGFEGLYVVSDLGRIMRVKTVKGTKAGLIKKPSVSRCGYSITQLCKDGSLYSVRVHRVVAEAFLPNPDGKREVNHKNGNKADNRVVNLEWATKSENQKHRFSHLGHDIYHGEDNVQAKLTNDDVWTIRSAYKAGATSMRKLAQRYGVSQPLIWQIIHRQGWDHI